MDILTYLNIKDIERVSEIFSNFSEGLFSICSIILLLLGLVKMKTMIELYGAKHFEAIYGFYSNLETYCFELSSIIKTNNNYWARIDRENGREKTPQDYEYEHKLRDIAKKLIEKYETEKDQVLPKRKRYLWKKSVEDFKKKLVKLTLIDEADSIGYGNYEIFKKELDKDIDSILKIISKEKK